MTRFRNPSNGYVETVDNPGLWCFLFGGFYFAYKGAAAAAFLVGFTPFLSWLWPLFARRVITKSYLQRGWQPVNGLLTAQGEVMR